MLGSIEQAAPWLKLGAEQNILIAQLRLAEIYKRYNLVEAAHWFYRAATKGNAIAQRELGLIFLKGGKGVRRSYFKGISFLGAASEKGDAVAQVALAKIYFKGRIVERDSTEGLRLLQAAAAKAYAPAYVELGRVYSNGKYITQDLDEAKTWLEKAARRTNDSKRIGCANYYLGKIAERTGDSEAALALYKKASAHECRGHKCSTSKGSTLALIRLGNIYLKGTKEIARDVGKARQYLVRAAKRGNRVAQYNLGVSWTFKSKW